MKLSGVVIIKTRVVTGKSVRCVVHARFEDPQHLAVHGLYLFQTDGHKSATDVFYFKDIEAAKKAYIAIHEALLDSDLPVVFEGTSADEGWLGKYNVNGFWRNAVNSDN